MHPVCSLLPARAHPLLTRSPNAVHSPPSVNGEPGDPHRGPLWLEAEQRETRRSGRTVGTGGGAEGSAVSRCRLVVLSEVGPWHLDQEQG